jgi:hypothetical protein
MGLLFNKEIQSQYYQNTSVSMEGEFLEWINKRGGQHTRYFGHWSDDSKQDAAATTRDMRAELSIKGDPNNLVEGLTCSGTVWKGTDGAAESYRCDKSIYGQGIPSAELGIIIDAQVEALGRGKWWLDGKTGSNKGYCQQCICAINTLEEADGGKKMMSAKWVDWNGVVVAVSPAAKCVWMLSDPSHINGIKSEGIRAREEQLRSIYYGGCPPHSAV